MNTFATIVKKKLSALIRELSEISALFLKIQTLILQEIVNLISRH